MGNLLDRPVDSRVGCGDLDGEMEGSDVKQNAPGSKYVTDLCVQDINNNLHRTLQKQKLTWG